MAAGVRRAIALCSLIATAIAFFSSPMFGAAKLAFNYYDPISIAEFRLRWLSTDDIAAKIEEAIAEKDFSDASKLVEIGEEQGHTFDPELVARTKEGLLRAGWRNANDLVSGFLSGNVETFGSFPGAILADYFGFGDIRDATVEGTKAASGEDYDAITLGASVVGILTVLPGTGTLDVGASVVKNANKAKKLTAPMARFLKKAFSNLVDLKALKKPLSASEPLFKMPSIASILRLRDKISVREIEDLDFSRLRAAASEIGRIDSNAIRKKFDGVLRPEELEEVVKFTGGVSTVAYGGGLRAAFQALSKSDDPTDLSRYGMLAKKAGKRSSPIIRLLGKSSIYLGKLVYAIIGAVIYAVVWVLGAIWSVFAFVRNLRRLR
ncbi:transcriptional regulator [Mesorhizobium sp. AR10]|uniref:transcriptional regulator n=1 Tax=Mesorhizobium sp. AR10 TaxID=2865839 RepID=UPI00215E8CA1|nr:transcriptional regulator [Mesorhizobium sp. AR10]UVK39368.1 transcriptional regulator [Mesorhizobium sp. AR10]